MKIKTYQFEAPQYYRTVEGYPRIMGLHAGRDYGRIEAISPEDAIEQLQRVSDKIVRITVYPVREHDGVVRRAGRVTRWVNEEFAAECQALRATFAKIGVTIKI